MNTRRIVLIAALTVVLAPQRMAWAEQGVTDWLIVPSDAYPTLKSAVDALAAMTPAPPAVPLGGTIYVKAGIYLQTEEIPITTASIRIIGAGARATILRWTTAPFADIAVEAEHVVIEDLQIDGGTGIRLDANALGGHSGQDQIIRGFEMRNVDMINMAGYCIETVGSTSLDNWVTLNRIEGCHFSNNLFSSTGIIRFATATNTTTIKNCLFDHCRNVMIDFNGSGSINVANCTFDLSSSAYDWPAMIGSGVNSVCIQECLFKDTDASQSGYFIQASGQAMTLANCQFVRPGQASGRAFQAIGNLVIASLSVINPQIDLGNTSTPSGADLDIGSADTHISAVGGITSAGGGYVPPRINDNGNATFLGNFNQRIRVPRVSDATALQDAKAGDLVYDLQAGTLKLYQNNTWIVLKTSP